MCFFTFCAKMASITALSTTTVAIPATYWADKYIKNEKWFSKKEKMFYEGAVESDYYCNMTKCNIYKVRLLATNEVVWLNESEYKNCNIATMPLDGEFVVQSDDTESASDSDDDANLNSKKPKPRRKQKAKAITALR